jgi:putative Mn2+ efflux pump MntP
MLGPLLLIVIGVLFLLNNMYPGSFRFGKMWPVILIVIGLSKVIEYFQGSSEKFEEKKEGQ